jgi:hypothetical protein
VIIKELIEYFEKLVEHSTQKMDQHKKRSEWKAWNYQLGQKMAYRISIAKLKQIQEEETK